MTDTKISNYNFVGQLQETCMKLKLSQPHYNEDTGVNNQFQCTCKLGKWSSIGIGFNKKAAKQRAAEEMMKIIKNENVQEVEEKSVNEEKSVSKLSMYCVKEKLGELPLYSEKPKEDNLFVIECKFKDYSATGKGPNKKIAKEAAADLVATHFKVHEYCNVLKKIEDRVESLKTPTTCLHELCQKRKLETTFTEKKVLLDKVNMYVATCEVAGKRIESSMNVSKKSAKMEAAQLMLNLLNSQTPESSLASTPRSEKEDASDDDQQAALDPNRRKRKVSTPEVYDSSSDDEPCQKSVICE